MVVVDVDLPGVEPRQRAPDLFDACAGLPRAADLKERGADLLAREEVPRGVPNLGYAQVASRFL